MSFVTVLGLFFFTALVIRAASVPSTVLGKISLGLVFLIYANLALIHYLWLQAPKEVQMVNYFLFGSGAILFTFETLAYFLKKSNFLPENLNLFRKHRKGAYQEILLACQTLAEAKQGALMIIERKQNLAAWGQKGIPIDAKISKELIYSVFTPPGALHDGAALFQKDRLAACAVIVPLTSNPRLPKDLGTRHRAAVGFSEITDGICLVVSEETGSVSIADRGILNYDIPFSMLPEALERALRFKRQKRKASFPARRQTAAV